MNKVTIGVFIMLFSSCIPTKIAPKIETYKITVAKKFKKTLPKQHAFIFEDPKDANQFYDYINTKYQLNNINVENNVPFTINANSYYLSFYETTRETKTINLVPVIIDAKRNQNGNDSMLEDAHTSRTGTYYIVLTVTDVDLKNCLTDDYKNKQSVVKFLADMRNEYLTTHNYEELLFKKKS